MPPPPQPILTTPYEELYGPPASELAPPLMRPIPTTPYDQLFGAPAMQLAPLPQQLISTAGFEQLYGPQLLPPPVITKEYEKIHRRQPTPTPQQLAYLRAGQQARRSAYRSGSINVSHTSLTRSQTKLSLM